MPEQWTGRDIDRISATLARIILREDRNPTAPALVPTGNAAVAGKICGDPRPRGEH